MDIQPQSTKPISDDQELAKALAGVTQTPDNIDFDEDSMSLPTNNNQQNNDAPAPKTDEPAKEDDSQSPVIGYNAPMNNSPMPTPTPAPAPMSIPIADNDLNGVKKDALTELRPLVDKLDLSPEEKFDTYLLLIRSTDDKALIAPAHEAARNIADEARRAQALLDIIKEIDYLSAPQQPNA